VKITSQNQVKGTLTIGYGHTKNVKIGQKITVQEAEQLLMNDLTPFANGVLKEVKVPITQNMFEALVSFTYNVGLGALRTSTLLKNLNQENYKEASNQFSKWISSKGQILQGLVKRREAEKALFLKDMYILQYFLPDGLIIEKKKSL